MAALLLDTHAALWWWCDVPRLTGAAHDAIATAQTVFVSAISALEIAQKWRIGKMPMIDDPAVNYPALMTTNRFIALPLSQDHALRAGLLPGKHRDPFDRLIAAQALVDDLTLVTCDPQFAPFGCKVLW